MRIVSISGLIGSGKDTAAEHLVQVYGYTRLSFSKPLKDITATLFGWDRDMVEGLTADHRKKREEVDEWWSEKLDMDVTPRSMLQMMGTEVMRQNLHQDIWVLAAERWVLSQNDDARIVITDARFFNELEMVNKMGGNTVGIYRKLPTWLDDFYSKTDKNFRDWAGVSFMDAARIHENIKLVRDCAAKALRDLKVSLHQSEWEHLLWNDYKKIIDNTSGIAHLHEQVDEIG